MSKSVWAGLRVGWIHAAGPVRDRLLRHRARVDLGTPLLSQHVAMSVVAGLDTVLTDRLPILRDRRDRCVEALTRELPDWDVFLPHGGLAVWVRLPDTVSRELVAAGRHRGVTVMPGVIARADRARADPHLRLCFDREPAVLAAGIDRLREAAADVAAGGLR